MNYEDQLERVKLFIEYDWKCQAENCNNDIREYGTPQLGHIINQSNEYIKKFGKEVIHHKLNVLPTCSLKCNRKVSICGKHLLIEKHVKKIKKKIALEKKLKSSII